MCKIGFPVLGVTYQFLISELLKSKTWHGSIFCQLRLHAGHYTCLRWQWIVQGVIWFVKPIHNSMLCGWLHGNVVDRTLLNKNKFMHPYTAFLQMILFFFSFFKYIFCCQMLHYHWFCSETVQAKWEKYDSHFRFWWQMSQILVADVTLFIHNFGEQLIHNREFQAILSVLRHVYYSDSLWFLQPIWCISNN